MEFKIVLFILTMVKIGYSLFYLKYKLREVYNG